MMKQLLWSASFCSLSMLSYADSHMSISGPLTSTFTKHEKLNQSDPYCPGGMYSGICMYGRAYGYPMITTLSSELASLKTCTIYIGYRLPSQIGKSWNLGTFLAPNQTYGPEWSGTQPNSYRWGRRSGDCTQLLPSLGQSWGVSNGASSIQAQAGNDTMVQEINRIALDGEGICHTVGVFKGYVDFGATGVVAMKQPDYQAYSCGVNESRPPDPISCIASIPSTINLGVIGSTDQSVKSVTPASVWCSGKAEVSLSFSGAGERVDVNMQGGMTARLDFCDNVSGKCGGSTTKAFNVSTSAGQDTLFNIQTELIGERFSVGEHEASAIIFMSYK